MRISKDNISYTKLAGYILAILLILLVFVIGVVYRNRLIGNFVLTGIIAMTLGLAIVFQPQIGGYILIATIISNISTFAVKLGLPSINKPLVILISVSVLASYLINKRKQLPKLGRLEWFFMSYIIIIAISTLTAEYKIEAKDTVISFLKNFVIIVSIIYALQNPKYWKQAIWIVILITTLLASLGAYQALSGNYDQVFSGFAIVLEQKILDGVTVFRLSGPIARPNYWAQFMVAVLPLIFYRIFDEKKILIKGAAIAASIIIGYAIFGTYSRGGFIALVAILFLIFLERRGRASVYLFLTIGTLLTLFILPTNYSERIRSLILLAPGTNDRTIYEDSSFRGRLAEARAGIRMFADYPILGIGAGNYKPSYQTYVRTLNIETRSEPRDAHSLYIETMAETGLAGSIIFTLFFGSLIIRLSKISKAIENQPFFESWNTWIVSIRMSIVSYLISSIFLHGDYIRYLWVLVALGIAGLYLSQKFLQDPNLLFQEEGVIA